MAKTCPQCGVESVVFPDVLGHPEPVNETCLKCGARLKKKSSLGRIKNMMKWDRYWQAYKPGVLHRREETF